jgi:hypothetical protein
MKKAEEGLKEYERSVMERWYSKPTRLCPFKSFFDMTDILFPVHSGLDDDNINIDANFGDPSKSSLDPPTQLETPPSQSIPSMPIPFPTSHHDANPASLANITDDATTNKIRTEYHPRSNRPAKVGHIDLEYGASTQHECPTLAPWWPFFRL